VVVSGVEFEITDATTATIPTFDAGVTIGVFIPQAYGDRVTSSTMGNFGYGGGENDPFTPNVEFSYVSNLVYLPSGAGDLLGTVFGNRNADGVNVALTADPGFDVLLHGFDIAPFAGGALVASAFEITDGAGNVLFSQPGITIVGGSSSTHSSFDFATPLRAEEIRIRAIGLESTGRAFAIDNIEFSQASIGSNRFNQTTHGTVFFDSDESGTRNAGERGVGNTTDFDFEPTNEGNYVVTVTATGTATGTEHSDSLLLRVAGAPPAARIDTVGGSVSMIDEGTTL
jgi:hypothetical protein